MEMKGAHLSLDKQDASLKVFPSDLATPSYFSWFHDWKTQSSFAKERERDDEDTSLVFSSSRAAAPRKHIFPMSADISTFVRFLIFLRVKWEFLEECYKYVQVFFPLLHSAK